MIPLSRTRVVRAVIVIAVAVASVALVIAMIAGAGIRGSQTFIVEARVTGVTIAFDGERSWDLGPARGCEALPLDEIRRGAPQGEAPCESARFREARDFDGAIDWVGEGRTAAVDVRPSGALEIEVTGARGLPDRSRVLVSPEGWRDAGAQYFVGTARIDAAFTGETGLLLEGRYEAREAPRLSLLSGPRTDVVKAGPLLRGEGAEIVEGPDPEGGYAAAEVFGHLTAADPGRLGLHLVAVSRPRNTALAITHPGADEPALIRPNWVDRALVSPLVIALIAILASAAGVMQLLLGIVDYLEKPAGRADARAGGPPRHAGRDVSAAGARSRVGHHPGA